MLLNISRRFDFANHARRLLEDDWQDSDDLEDDEGDAMEVTAAEKEKTRTRNYRPGRYYRNQVRIKCSSYVSPVYKMGAQFVRSVFILNRQVL